MNSPELNKKEISKETEQDTVISNITSNLEAYLQKDGFP